MNYEESAIELMKIQAQINRLKANQQMDGYTQGEIFALGYIYESGKRACPNEISKAMAVSSARVAVILNHMEQKNWVLRSSDKSDNRKTIVEMTDLGEEIFLQRQREVIDSVAGVLRELGEEDTKALLRIRKKMIHE